MKKFRKSILLTMLLVVAFSSSAFAFLSPIFKFGDDVEIGNITGSIDKVFMVDENKNPVQTYIGKNLVNIMVVTDELDNLSVTKILPVDGYWTLCDEVNFVDGGVFETGVKPYSIINLKEEGLYYLKSEKNGTFENMVIYIKGETDYTTNGFIAEYAEFEVDAYGNEDVVGGFVLDYEAYLKLDDIAKMFVGTEEEFYVMYVEDFDLYNIITEKEYEEIETLDCEYELGEKKLAVSGVARELFANYFSTKIETLLINDENYYNISDFKTVIKFDLHVSIVDSLIKIQ